MFVDRVFLYVHQQFYCIYLIMSETDSLSGCRVTIRPACKILGGLALEGDVERLRPVFRIPFLPLRRLHKHEERISIHAKLLVYHTRIASP